MNRMLYFDFKRCGISAPPVCRCARVAGGARDAEFVDVLLSAVRLAVDDLYHFPRGPPAALKGQEIHCDDP